MMKSNRLHNKNQGLLALSLLASLASQNSFAALSVTDGGFANPVVADGAFDTNITNWFDENGSNNFSSFIFHSTSEFGAGSTQLLAFGPANGYVYQSLGLKSAGESLLTVSLDAFERPVNTRFFPTLEIDIYAGAFAGAANGTDIDAGLTSLGTLTLTGADLFTTPADGSDGESQLSFTVPGSVDISGQALGTEIWMRLHTPDATGNTSAIYIDNVSVATAIPEPFTGSLLGLGALALLRRRRA